MTATRTVRVDPANVEQLRAWDGDEGAYWAAHADRFDRAVAGYHRRLLEVAAIAGDERVLDIGCGTGQTTRDAARAASGGAALGVDLSALMLEHARRRAAAEGVGNAHFEQVDAQIHPFDTAGFDVAISRTGAMFFGDLVAAFTNIARAVRPGGRLSLVTWQPLPQNEWIGALVAAMAAGRDAPTPPPDAPGPFSLADPDRVRGILGRAGFTDIELDAVSDGMWLGDDTDEAQTFVVGLLGWMLEPLDDSGRARALDALRASLDSHVTSEGVVYGSAAWLVRATRP